MTPSEVERRAREIVGHSIPHTLPVHYGVLKPKQCQACAVIDRVAAALAARPCRCIEWAPPGMILSAPSSADKGDADV